jgi:hypothetical protein
MESLMVAELPASELFLKSARGQFAAALRKIQHCLNQLADDDVRWRATPGLNSIAIIIAHLCGNVRQWIVAGVGGKSDVRNRPAEFRDPGAVTREELLRQIEEAVSEVDRTLAGLDPSSLTRARRIQGFDETVMSAIFDTASHFVGHTHQIVYITRLRLGDSYRFEWSPTSSEQGAEAPK